MANCKRITPTEMGKAWRLHEKGLSPEEVADTLDISRSSAIRIITVLEAAKNGDIDAIENSDATSGMVRYALEQYPIKRPSPEVTEENTAPQTPFDNTGLYLVAVLEALQRNNELLEKLCEAWGAPLADA